MPKSPDRPFPNVVAQDLVASSGPGFGQTACASLWAESLIVHSDFRTVLSDTNRYCTYPLFSVCARKSGELFAASRANTWRSQDMTGIFPSCTLVVRKLATGILTAFRHTIQGKSYLHEPAALSPNGTREAHPTDWAQPTIYYHLLPAGDQREQ